MGRRGNLKKIEKIFYMLIWLSAIPLTYSQFPNLKFENLDTSEGLSSSTCTEIFQDSEGFLWFATIDGLNKYNGYEFEIYRSILNDSTSISNNRINAITEDKYGNIWVGTNNGLNVFNKKTDRFYRIDLYRQVSLSNSPRKVINDVLYDEKNNVLWVATNNGAIRIILEGSLITQDKLDLSYYMNDRSNANSLDDNSVNSVVVDGKDDVFLITDGQYLNRYNGETDNFDRIYIDHERPYELNHLPKSVFVDSDDDFWIGNDLSNIILWSRKNNSFTHLSFADVHIPYRNLHRDNQGIIWASSDGHGLFLLNKEEKKVEQQIINNHFDLFSLPNNKPSALFEDSSGILWIGSYDKGVSKLDPAKYSFGHYYYQPDNAYGLNEKIIQSVLQDDKERIWISAYNGGLNLFNEEKKTYKHYSHEYGNSNSLSSNKILYTFESSDGKIWICTLDGGLNSFDPEHERFIRYEHRPDDLSSIGQNSVWAGVEDHQKRLWLGLRTEGLSLFNPYTKIFQSYKNTSLNENGLASNSIVCLFIDSKKRLLVGTALGLNIVELEKIEEYAPEQIHFFEVRENGVQGNRINYITEDHLGNIWLGTDNGIRKLDNDLKLIKSYSSQNGLPNNLVVGLKEDDNYNFWISTKSGLSFLNPTTHQFRNFNVHDGLQGSEFQTQSIEKTRAGRILVGGINGFNIFHPDDITFPSSVTLKPQITNFKLNNKKVVQGDTVNGRVLINDALDSEEKLKLRYNENYISFEFVALYFENPEQVQYAYKMHGLDEDFLNIGKNRVVNHSNLQPGNYVFEVKASIDGEWADAGAARLNIEILPPFWKTWWMYCIYVLAGSLLFWAVMYYYTQKVKENQRHELDQMKLRFFVNVSHEFRTPLTLILNPIDNILSSVHETSPVKSYALTIQRSARRLLHLMNQLLDYRKMDVGMSPLQLEKGNIVKFCKDIFSLFKGLAGKKEIDYRFNSDSENITTLFDQDKVEKIITNLISNAIKFTNSGGTIIVSMKKVSRTDKIYDSLLFTREKLGDYVEIIVEDSGVGLDKEQLKNIFSRFYNLDVTKSGTGIGLNFTKALVEMHGGDISVESQHKKGTKFMVRLPLNLKAQTEKVETFKNEFRINSMKAVEYDMLIANEEIDVVTKKNQSEETNFPTVLIVEDNKELRTHLTNDLKSNYNVKEAANGEKGLKLAKKYYPDIIISDVMMPKMDGFELCRQIKSEFETSHIPVLLLTAKSQDEDRVTGYHSGADGYLAKPFVTSVLKARISNLLEARKRLRKRFSEVGGIFPSSEVTTNNIDEAFLEKATKIVLDNIDDMEFKQENLLREMGVGRSQLYRKISSLTGNNPSYFIRTVRLRYASELLLKNQFSIKEVSYMTGFNSTAYFSKTFRELFNLTPTEFMEQKGKEDVSVKE